MQAKLFERFKVSLFLIFVNAWFTIPQSFCPPEGPLDSSLVAAILLDIDPDSEPSEEQINVIHATLSELSAQADALQFAEDFSDLPTTDDSTPSFTQGETSTSGSSSGSSQQPFSTPLGFLQAALPHIRTQDLHHALLDAESADGDPDMWDIVARILSEESIREMEERGLDGLDDSEESVENEWEMVGKKKTPRSADIERPKKDKGKKKKVVLVDIRQQQHTRPSASDPAVSSRSFPAPDPWTQISSLSTHLASLLPSQQPSFFMTYFHSPKYSTPYHALVEALRAITKPGNEDYTPMLISLLDILIPFYDDLDPEQYSRLVSDTELSLNATQGCADEALDLVHLLRDLDEDSTSGFLEMGIYHQPITPSSNDAQPSKSSQAGKPGSASIRRPQLPSGPPPVPPPPFLKGKNPSQRSGNKPSPYQWQSVPQRRSRKTPHPLAEYIPAYTRDVNGIKVRGSGNGLGKGGKGDVGELTEFRKRIGDSMRRRNEMLREASRMWQKGNAKSRGGEVALYFAERVCFPI